MLLFLVYNFIKKEVIEMTQKDEEDEAKNLDEFSRLNLSVELRHPQDAEDLPMLAFEIENVEYEED
jgi:hypothetical protein